MSTTQQQHGQAHCYIASATVAIASMRVDIDTQVHSCRHLGRSPPFLSSHHIKSSCKPATGLLQYNLLLSDVRGDSVPNLTAARCSLSPFILACRMVAVYSTPTGSSACHQSTQQTESQGKPTQRMTPISNGSTGKYSSNVICTSSIGLGVAGVSSLRELRTMINPACP